MRKYAMSYINRSSLISASFFRGYVTVSNVSLMENGIEMYNLANDLTLSKYPVQEQNKPCQPYITDSVRTFKSNLKPNSYYVLVDKAVKKGDTVRYGGHILSFLTDNESNFINDATMSLRPGTAIPNKTLIYTQSHIGSHKEETRSVRKIDFYDIEKELKEHFSIKRFPITWEQHVF